MRAASDLAESPRRARCLQIEWPASDRYRGPGSTAVRSSNPSPQMRIRQSKREPVPNSSGDRRRSSWCLVLAAVLVLLLGQSSRGAEPSGRPESLQIEGWLANFDHDREVDGWKVRLMLFDADGRPVVVRGHVSIRISPNAIGPNGRAYRAGEYSIQRWSKPLEFDERGLMTMTLPAAASLRQVITATRSTDQATRRADGFVARQVFVPSSHPSQFVPSAVLGVGGSTPGYRGWSPLLGRRISFDRGRSRTRWRLTGPDHWTVPAYGHLQARVSVPGHGVYEADSDVRLQEPVKTFRWHR